MKTFSRNRSVLFVLLFNAIQVFRRCSAFTTTTPTVAFSVQQRRVTEIVAFRRLATTSVADVAPTTTDSVTTTTDSTSSSATTTDNDNNEEMTIPTNLPSDCGMDYVPLATMLATGQFEKADQVCLF